MRLDSRHRTAKPRGWPFGVVGTPRFSRVAYPISLRCLLEVWEGRVIRHPQLVVRPAAGKNNTGDLKERCAELTIALVALRYIDGLEHARKWIREQSGLQDPSQVQIFLRP